MNGRVLRGGLNAVLLAAMIFVLSGCGADDRQSRGFWHSRDEFFASATKDLSGLPDDVLNGMGDHLLRNKNSFVTLLAAGGASIAMHQHADNRIADNFANHQNLSSFADTSLDLVGGPGFHFAAAGLWYALAIENDSSLNKDRAWTMIKALSVTGFTTLSLKLIRHDHTPNDKSLAWPSGHTSSSFTVAAVLDEFYGPQVGIPAYALAGLVGYRMMEVGDHWGSDVLFGAVLGYIVGHEVAGEKEITVAGYNVLPYCDYDGSQTYSGLLFYKRF